MNKDPGIISSVLDFFSKKLDKFVDKDIFIEDYYQKTKEILRIETSTGMGKIMFYNVKGDEFDGKSLLEYIDSQNVRLTRQREELIDLSIKIAKIDKLCVQILIFMHFLNVLFVLYFYWGCF